MNGTTRPKRAILLVRISDDKAEDASGVGRQEEDGRKLADRLGWGIAELLTENDTSAFKRRRIRLPDGSTALRTVRPKFRTALDKLASGECDGLLAYDLDRVARDPRDLEDLIDVVEQRSIPVQSVTGSLRLSNDSDITMARVMVAVANKSSRDTSRRVQRKHEDLAAQGKRHGGGFRSYGYDRRGLNIIEEEASVVREIAAWILDGWSLYKAGAELNRRGVPTVTGVKWNSRSIRSVVTKPSVAGLRVFRGDIVRGDDGQPIEASWPAILDVATWEEVCGVLSSRAGTADLTLKRWLTGVLHCSRCSHALGAGGPRYWCSTPQGGCGKIAINADPAEKEVQRQVLDLLTRPRVLERLDNISRSPASDDARRELAEDEEQLKELAGMWARKEMTLAAYREARKIIDERIKASQALIGSSAPRALRRLLAGDVRANWSALTAADKRDIALTLLPDGYEVRPHDRSRGSIFQPERLQPRGKG